MRLVSLLQLPLQHIVDVYGIHTRQLGLNEFTFQVAMSIRHIVCVCVCVRMRVQCLLYVYFKQFTTLDVRPVYTRLTLLYFLLLSCVIFFKFFVESVLACTQNAILWFHRKKVYVCAFICMRVCVCVYLFICLLIFHFILFWLVSVSFFHCLTFHLVRSSMNL